DPQLVQRVVESGWDARSLNPDKDQYELWYGSSVLLAAAEAGIIEAITALDRISPSFYGFAAERFDVSGRLACATRVNAALTSALSYPEVPALPAIEQS